MEFPKEPNNEAERLSALYALKLLDTVPEERFDRIARMAAHIFGVEFALVTLIEKDRQWFKSAVGLDGREAERKKTFCAHAILGDHVMVVPDAKDDNRFFDNPFVTGDPHVRFYAGKPLKTKDGLNVGTLCIFDPKPREFSEKEQKILEDLGSLAEDEFDNFKLALSDELTGLANRRGFFQIGEQILEWNQQLGRPVDVALFDLNGFKSINDRFGHATGDEALIQFAAVLTENLIEADLIARLGGDEFAAILSGLDYANERITKIKTFVRQIATDKINLDFSAGIVRYNSNLYKSLEAALEEADQLMYTDKKSAQT